jgi:threonine/homoserine/homoserine lactone efflux protein
MPAERECWPFIGERAVNRSVSTDYIEGDTLSIQLYTAFIVASAILLVIPGPTVLTVISYSLSHGRRANIPLVAAVALGDSTALAFSLLGLGALLATSAIWFALVKWIGGLYLLYLGLRLMRAGGSLTEMAESPLPDSRRRLFADTFMVTALNPKSIIFFVAFLPQFVNPKENVTRQLWLLACTFVMMAAINATVYTVFASSARRILTSPYARRCLHLTGGSLLSAAGLWALLARRPV